MRENISDLVAFLAVARERNFTRAAAQLGVSQSALSKTIRQLEARLRIQLLTRTTRSVALTEAGERLLDTVGPNLDEISAGLANLSVLPGKPAGLVRITAGDHAIRMVLWPKLVGFIAEYPDIKVELVAENGMTDIVAGRLDAGVRFGEQVEKDMIAVRIAPQMRFAVVGAPSCLPVGSRPETPQGLVGRTCINLRFPTLGGLYAWEFEKDGRELKVRVDGQLVFNQIFQILEAALAGFGLAYIPEDIARPYVEDGRLVSVLEDWCPPFPGYHLYYPKRRQQSPAFSKVVEALRFSD